jgi:tRNA-(ms[2]io[6]A)-hydroxylase
MAERRRLPVIQNAPQAEAEDEPRPPWHWVGFGTVAIFAAWLPLAYAGAAISARVMEARFGRDASKEAVDLAMASMSPGERARLAAIVALPTLLGLAIAAFAGGFIVGRFGTGTGRREAALSGAVTALIAIAVAWSGPTAGTLIAAVVTAAVAIGFAAWGGALSAARRDLARKRS